MVHVESMYRWINIRVRWAYDLPVCAGKIRPTSVQDGTRRVYDTRRGLGSVVSCTYILTPTRVHPIQELLSTSEPSVYMGPAHSKLRVHMRGKE